MLPTAHGRTSVQLPRANLPDLQTPNSSSARPTISSPPAYRASSPSVNLLHCKSQGPISLLATPQYQTSRTLAQATTTRSIPECPATQAKAITAEAAATTMGLLASSTLLSSSRVATTRKKHPFLHGLHLLDPADDSASPQPSYNNSYQQPRPPPSPGYGGGYNQPSPQPYAYNRPVSRLPIYLPLPSFANANILGEAPSTATATTIIRWWIPSPAQLWQQTRLVSAQPTPLSSVAFAII